MALSWIIPIKNDLAGLQVVDPDISHVSSSNPLEWYVPIVAQLIEVGIRPRDRIQRPMTPMPVD